MLKRGMVPRGMPASLNLHYRPESGRSRPGKRRLCSKVNWADKWRAELQSLEVRGDHVCMGSRRSWISHGMVDYKQYMGTAWGKFRTLKMPDCVRLAMLVQSSVSFS